MARMQEPFRTPADARRLERMGFRLSEMVFTDEASGKLDRDPTFREDLAPVREFMRPHVFSDTAARDAACRPPVPGQVLALEAVGAGDLGRHQRGPCLFAVGHGIDDRGFEEVASTIVDPEIVDLFERCLWRGTSGKPHRQDSIVVTVSGALYRLLVDEQGGLEVTAKPLFGAVPEDEVARTARHLLRRLVALSDSGSRRGGRDKGRPRH